MTNMKDYDVKYKVLLIGESGVGKTSLLRTLADDKFALNTMTTIGIDFKIMKFNVDGARVLLEIWDTAGQERFRTFTTSHMRGTQGLLLVFDLTRIETFRQLEYWMKSIEKQILSTEPPPKLIVGNKSDLVSERQVTYAMGEKMAEDNFERGYEETSCKTRENVHETFHKLAAVLVDTYHPLLLDAYKGKVTDYNRPKIKAEKRDSIILTKKDLHPTQSHGRNEDVSGTTPVVPSRCC